MSKQLIVSMAILWVAIGICSLPSYANRPSGMKATATMLNPSIRDWREFKRSYVEKRLKAMKGSIDVEPKKVSHQTRVPQVASKLDREESMIQSLAQTDDLKTKSATKVVGKVNLDSKDKVKTFKVQENFKDSQEVIKQSPGVYERRKNKTDYQRTSAQTKKTNKNSFASEYQKQKNHSHQKRGTTKLSQQYNLKIGNGINRG